MNKLIETSIKYNEIIEVYIIGENLYISVYAVGRGVEFGIHIEEPYVEYIEMARQQSLPIMWKVGDINHLCNFSIQNGDILNITIYKQELYCDFDKLFELVKKIRIAKIIIMYIKDTDSSVDKEDFQIFCNNIILVGKTQIELHRFSDYRDIEFEFF